MLQYSVYISRDIGTDAAMLVILLVSRVRVAYCVVGMLFSAALIVQERMHARKWLYVFCVMLVRGIILHIEPNVLPRWFIVYSTIPLIVCSVGENMLMHFASDRKTTQTLKDPDRATDDAGQWKMSAMAILMDRDIKRFYASAYEFYMYVCSIMIIEHHCVTLQDTALFACTWTLFTVTEEAKLNVYTRPIPLPSYIVKTIYILYAPSVFWITLYALSLMNIAMLYMRTARTGNKQENPSAIIHV